MAFTPRELKLNEAEVSAYRMYLLETDDNPVKTEEDWATAGAISAADRAEVARDETVAAAEDVTIGVSAIFSASKNLFDKDVAIENMSMGAWGSELPNASYYLSDYIAVVEGETYYGPNTRFVTAFDSKKDVMHSAGSDDQLNAYIVPSGVAYIRVTVYETNIDAYQLELGSEATSYETFVRELNAAVKIEPASLLVNSSKGEVLDVLGIQETLSERGELMGDRFMLGKNLFNKDTALVNHFMGDNGELKDDTAIYSCSDYIAVEEGSTYAIAGTRFLAAFDVDKTHLAGLGTNASISSYTVPASVAYVRITCLTSFLDNYQFELGGSQTDYEEYHYKINANARIYGSQVLTHWRGLTWSALGDSVTAQAKWITPVVNALGMILENNGVGGAQVGGDLVNSMWQDSRITTVSTDADLITVMGGTNDWANNRALGDTNSSDIAEYCGALNEIVSKLHARNGTARVVFVTPPYGEFIDYGARPGTWPNEYTNGAGLTTRDYADAMMSVAKKWSIPCVDVHQLAGINTLNKATYIGNDGAYLHPNEAGGERIAEGLLGFLKSIEPFDS